MLLHQPAETPRALGPVTLDVTPPAVTNIGPGVYAQQPQARSAGDAGSGWSPAPVQGQPNNAGFTRAPTTEDPGLGFYVDSPIQIGPTKSRMFVWQKYFPGFTPTADTTLADLQGRQGL